MGIPQALLAEAAKAGLDQFEVTQRIISNHHASNTDDGASGTAYLFATHIYRASTNKENWVVEGRNGFTVSLVDAAWVFERSALILRWQIGDPTFG